MNRLVARVGGEEYLIDLAEATVRLVTTDAAKEIVSGLFSEADRARPTPLTPTSHPGGGGNVGHVFNCGMTTGCN